MHENGLPLLDFFIRLREADLPLGIDDYFLMLRALQGGFGIADREALARLCRTLWVKSTEDKQVFDYYFSQLLLEHTDHHSIIQSPEHPTVEVKQETEFEFPSSLSEHIPTPASDLTTSTKTEPLIDPTNLEIDDEIQIAQAILHADNRTVDISYQQYNRYFVHHDEYFPVTRRQMKQNWRYLRHPIREGPPVELDIDATVKQLGREGVLLKPVFIPKRMNRAGILLLFDQDGSMVPFHALSRRLIETALRGGQLGNGSIYYFHNCPIEYIYRQPTRQEPEYIQDVVDRLNNGHTSVLIFSDAGAARGALNNIRIDSTKEFIGLLKHHFRYIAWLNPLPASRWVGTSAEEIKQFIPMFDTSRRGLDSVISALRGRVPKLIRSVRYKRNE